MTFGLGEKSRQTITIKPLPFEIKPGQRNKIKQNSFGRNLENLFHTPYKTSAQSPKQSVQDSINQNKFGTITNQSGRSIDDP